MWIQPVTLQGRRVTIRPMERDDINDLFEAGKDSEIWTYMPMDITSREDMETLVHQALQDKEAGTAFPFVIYDHEQEKLVGSTRFLNISEKDRHLEIGWTWLSPSVWRSQVNTQCKYLLLKHCFENLSTVRVQLKTDARNIRSQNAIDRIGGIREGVLRKCKIMHNGHVRDTVYYSILDEEWPRVREKIEKKLVD
ncbi:GNAT family N-acetyltransferase [Pseudalkalibacillus sp. Hm43]|uniref:GNAT family N-acetyltransferase n=1 Tax=Pseudalkalibacillus sp. Hm43 TaxID=3450742 RepID=UPI003F441E82